MRISDWSSDVCSSDLYWRQPEKTAAEFRRDGFFITGDVVTIDERGYIHIVGRAKDLIISGGFNVYPNEIELCIDQIPGVQQDGKSDDEGERVCVRVDRRGGLISKKKKQNNKNK